jgi:hypothetical protein
MAKVKLVPTTADAFAVGKIVGATEALEEILEMSKMDSMTSLRIYLKARIKSLKESPANNPFKRND